MTNDVGFHVRKNNSDDFVDNYYSHSLQTFSKIADGVMGNKSYEGFVKSWVANMSSAYGILLYAIHHGHLHLYLFQA